MLPEISGLMGIPNASRLVHRLVHNFPKLQDVFISILMPCFVIKMYRLQAQVQPITRSLLRINLSIVPDFRWDKKIHGTAENFLILIEDVDGEVIVLKVSLTHDVDEDDQGDQTVVAPFYPLKKLANWWLIRF